MQQEVVQERVLHMLLGVPLGVLSDWRPDGRSEVASLEVQQRSWSVTCPGLV